MPNWLLGPQLIVKKSRFIGAVASVGSLEEAHRVLKAIKKHDELKSATHHISAVRIVAGVSSVLEEANDNGEPPAGRRILQILKNERLSNTLVVVLRWYGGKKLGSERFRVIDDTAASAIDAWKSKS